MVVDPCTYPTPSTSPDANLGLEVKKSSFIFLPAGLFASMIRIVLSVFLRFQAIFNYGGINNRLIRHRINFLAFFMLTEGWFDNCPFEILNLIDIIRTMGCVIFVAVAVV